MTSLAVATDGLPIYDVAGQQLFQMGSVITDSEGVVTDINPANGVPRDANGEDIPQPTQLTRVNDLMAHPWREQLLLPSQQLLPLLLWRQ
jgi:hypothetical protein